MGEVKDPVALRPLEFGEIFDRAVTLYLKNFLPFVGIALIAVVPLVLVQCTMDSQQSSLLTQVLGDILQSHNSKSMSALEGTLAVFVLFLGVLVQPIVYGAIAFGIERLYRGGLVAFRPCFGVALQRWPRILGLAALAVLAVSTAIAAIILGAAEIVNTAHGAINDGAGSIAVVLIAFLAIMLTTIWLFVPFMFALYAIVVEDLRVLQAIGSGFRRIFNRNELLRAAGLTICSAITVVVAQIFFVQAAWLVLYLGAIWLLAVVEALSLLLVVPFAIIVLAIYYFDVRVRREGLDFQRRLGLTLRGK